MSNRSRGPRFPVRCLGLLTLGVGCVAVFLLLVDRIAYFQHVQHSAAYNILQQPGRLKEELSVDVIDRDSLVQSRFKERMAHLKRKCNTLSVAEPNTSCSHKSLQQNILFMKDKNVAFCSIEKTGSTFWKRILHFAGGRGDSVYSVKTEKIDETKDGGFSRYIKENVSSITKAVKKATSFFFVRDPYTRAFSGWYDKFYSPNHLYWGVDSSKILKSERHGVTEASLRCASDVTFVEFIQYLTKVLRKPNSCYDGHFSTNHEHCFPCSLDYNYLGKFETLKEDTEFLLKQLNLSERITFPNLETNAAVAELRDSSAYIFAKKTKITKCITFRCALFRLWRRFQGRGIIATHLPLPVDSNSEADNLTQIKLDELLIRAHNDSDNNSIQNNRKEALSQALSSLGDELLQKFKEVFKVDFELFDYSSASPILDYNISFDYFKQCPF